MMENQRRPRLSPGKQKKKRDKMREDQEDASDHGHMETEELWAR
jgi:hypothetical protein